MHHLVPMLIIQMLRLRFAYDVSQGRPLFDRARYLAETVEPSDVRWGKARALLCAVAEDGDEILVVYGEGFDDGQAFIAGRQGRDWVVVGTAERT